MERFGEKDPENTRAKRRKLPWPLFSHTFSMDVSFLLEKATLIVSLMAGWFVYTMYSKPNEIRVHDVLPYSFFSFLLCRLWLDKQFCAKSHTKG